MGSEEAEKQAQELAETGGSEEQGGDQDAEPATTPEQVDADEERDQAEG